MYICQRVRGRKKRKKITTETQWKRKISAVLLCTQGLRFHHHCFWFVADHQHAKPQREFFLFFSYLLAVKTSASEIHSQPGRFYSAFIRLWPKTQRCMHTFFWSLAKTSKNSNPSPGFSFFPLFNQSSFTCRLEYISGGSTGKGVSYHRRGREE